MGGSEWSPVEGAHGGGQAAHSQGQGAGNGQPRRQVAQSWPQVDEINWLTAERPGLFEIEAFALNTFEDVCLVRTPTIGPICQRHVAWL